MRALAVRRLGCVEYEDGLELMRVFAEARKAGAVPDTLMVLEHPHVVTLGRGARRDHLLASREELARLGVELVETDRGGDVTYHGPGQVVGYPILDLAPDRKDVRRYVRDLEEIMIQAAARFGVRAHRADKLTGVWVGEDKLGAIGVHISRWITTHGFAFNAAPDLALFQKLIVPCGIRDRGVTSLEQLLGRPVQTEAAEAAVVVAASSVLGGEVEETSPELETVLVVVRRGEEVLLLQRLETHGGFWQPVTGGIEAGESPQAAAERELFEETGLRGTPSRLGYVHSFAMGPWVRRYPRWSVCREHAFTFEVPANAEVRLAPDEHRAAEWLPAAEAAARVPFAGLRRGIRLAVAGRSPSMR